MADHIKHLHQVADADVQGLMEAEKQYGSSWKKRGGVGAFMMLARKWDRLEKALAPTGPKGVPGYAPRGDAANAPWDIFRAIEVDPRAEGIIDDIRDLRRYLMLVESEMIARGAASANSEHRDSKK